MVGDGELPQTNFIRVDDTLMEEIKRFGEVLQVFMGFGGGREVLDLLEFLVYEGVLV